MKKYCYVTLLSTASYLPGVYVLYKSLRRFSSLPFLCLCSRDIDKRILAFLAKTGIETKILSERVFDSCNEGFLPQLPVGFERWIYTFDKLYIWTLVEYDKIVFVDSDMMICSNIDELFEKENMSAVPAGHILYPDWVRLNSGTMVIIPSMKTFEDLKSCIVPTIIERNTLNLGTGDQDVINYYYHDWPINKELHLEDKFNLFFDHIEVYKGLKLPPQYHTFCRKSKTLEQTRLHERSEISHQVTIVA